MTNLLLVAYGRETEVDNAITLAKNLTSDHINPIVATVIPCKNQYVTESLLEHSCYEIHSEYAHLFYYFNQDRFINELSELNGYVAVDNTIEDIWTNFYRTVDYILKIYDQYSPNIVYSGAPDNYFVDLFIKIAEIKKIKYFWLEDNYFFKRSYTFYSNITYTNPLILRKSTQYSEVELQQIQNHFKKDVIQSNPSLFYKNNFFDKVQDNIRYFLSMSAIQKLSPQNLMLLPYAASPRNNIKNKYIRFKNKIRNSFYIRHFLKIRDLRRLKENNKIILFALHYQPEAATLSMQPLFNDQYYLIKLLSDILPPGYLLVIKDHPLQNIGLRKSSFFTNIIEKKNTFFIASDLSSKQLIEEKIIDKVITIGGTIGFEELLRKSPPLIFSEIYYSNFKYCFRADLTNISSLINTLFEFLQFDYSKVQNDYDDALKLFLSNYYDSIIKNCEKYEAIQNILHNLDYYWGTE